jgi:hypothetical protein
MVWSPNKLESLFQFLRAELAGECGLTVARKAPYEAMVHLQVGSSSLDHIAVDVRLSAVQVDHVTGRSGDDHACARCGGAVVERVYVQIGIATEGARGRGERLEKGRR